MFPQTLSVHMQVTETSGFHATPWRFGATLLAVNCARGIRSNVSLIVVLLMGAFNVANAQELRFALQPRSHNTLAGDTTFFQVTLLGQEPFFYQWQKNGMNLQDSAHLRGTSEAKLLIPSVTWEDEGNYSVLVTNPFGELRSLEAYLNVSSVSMWSSGFSGYLQIVDQTLDRVVGISMAGSEGFAVGADGRVESSSRGLINAPLNIVAIVGGEDYNSELFGFNRDHRIALRSDGGISAWGDNSFGQTNIPIYLTNVVGIAAGAYHSVALRADGTVSAWGRNTNGQANVPPGLRNVVQVACGRNHSVALLANGSVVAWGRNTAEQTNVPPGLTNVVAIAAGGNYNLALTSAGAVVGWGRLLFGEEAIPTTMTNVVAVATGVDQALALQGDGKVIAWPTDSFQSPAAPENLKAIVTIAAGTSYSMAMVGKGEPRITHRIPDRHALVGDASYFYVQATGELPLTYQWMLDGMDLPQATNTFFAITNSRIVQSGEYTVRVSNRHGTATSPPSRLVVTPAWFYSEPGDLTATPGSTATFSASIESRLPTSYQWQFNGENIQGATNSTLKIRGISEADEGRYSVVVSNQSGAVTSEAGLLSVATVAAWGANGAGQTKLPPALTNVVAIAAGESNSLALRADGVLMAWGRAEQGETDNPAVLTGVAAIASGSNHTLALLSNGRVTAWGRNLSGQASAPAELSNVVAIAAGQAHSLALNQDGTVMGWGQTKVPEGLENIVAIAAGGSQSIALRADGTVAEWGGYQAAQTNIVGILTNVIAVAAGTSHSLALLADGKVAAWGDNSFHQLEVPLGLANVVAIACGFHHSLALRRDGTVVAWGDNRSGQLNVVEGLTNVVAVAAGGYHSIALVGTGRPVITRTPATRVVAQGGKVILEASAVGALPLRYQWRFNGTNIADATNRAWFVENAQPDQAGRYEAVVENGLGTVTNRFTEVSTVSLWIADQPQSQINPILGGSVTFSITARSSAPVAYQWLFNDQDLRGETQPTLYRKNLKPADSGLYSVVASNYYGVVTSSSARLRVGVLVGWGALTPGEADLALGLTNVLQTSCGDAHSLILLADGTVAGWGSNRYGQTDVPPNLTHVTAVAAGAWHSLALQADGTVVAWGAGGEQTRVPDGLTDVVAIAAGNYHSLALKRDGTVVAWGNNFDRQTEVPKSLSHIVAIAAGSSHSLALRVDGSVFSWGGDFFGPVQVPSGLGSVIAIAAGDSRSLALRANGTVTAWANNQFAQASVPIGLNKVVAIAASRDHNLALRADGTVVAWGSDDLGESKAPSGLTNVVAIAAGGTHSLAIQGFGGPMIQGQLPDYQIAVGGTAYLKANTAGAPPLSFRWLQDGREIANATNALLALSNAQPGQTGNYSLEISNAEGLIRRHQTHVDVVPAWFTSAPQVPTNQFIGRDVTLTIAVRANVPVSYQWLFNGNEIAGATNSTLRLSKPTLDANGRYSVTVSNRYGTATSATTELNLPSVVAWGSNFFDQSTMPDGLTDVIAISAGDYYSLALRRNGTVIEWGFTPRDPIGVLPSLTNITAITAGYNHSLALRSDGTVAVWGDNSYGQTNVPLGLKDVTSIASGNSHCLALKANGTVIAWGNNSAGQTNVPSTLTNVVAVAAGGSQSVALRADGSAVAWGEVRMPEGITNVIQIAAGDRHMLAVLADGAVVPRGENGTDQNEVAPNNLPKVVAIATGFWHSLALQRDGRVTAWGTDFEGETAVPVGLQSVIAVAAGSSHSLALIGNGKPLLTSELLDRFAVTGGKAYFQASVAGAPPFNYQWSLNGLPLLGETNSILWVTNATVDRVGAYSVRVANTLGEATSRAAKLAIVPAWFSVQPRDQVIAEGGSALLSARAESTVPSFYQWFFKDTPLREATNFSLRLNELSLSDNGIYYVVASNNYGSITSVLAQMTVWQPLELTAEGRGSVEIEPGPYTFGDIVVARAIPNRWAAFDRWSDNNFQNPRSFLIGVSNHYAALFTNTLALERWTNTLSGQTFEVPIGTPRIYINDTLTFGGSLLFPDTNQVVVRMESSLGDDSIQYTLDGEDPSFGEVYVQPFEISAPAIIQAFAEDASNYDASPRTDPVTVGFLPTLRAWTRGGGSLSATPSRPAYGSNDLVTLTATPFDGWTFLYWSGDANSTNSSIQFSMDRTKIIEAVFGTSMTNSSFGGGGDVGREPPEGPYPYGSTVWLSATPQNDKYFLRWIDAANGLTSNPLQIVVTNANQLIRARFATLPANSFALNLGIAGNGQVQRSPEALFYSKGASVSLTALPATDQVFTGWSGDLKGLATPAQIQMDSSKHITGHFISTLGPVVSLTSPTNQTSYGAPGTIYIEANASDPDGRIAKVEFFAGTRLLSTLVRPPFNFNWTGVPIGTNELTALAYDDSGLKTASSPITVTVNPPARFRFSKSSDAAGEGDHSVSLTVVNEGIQGGTINYETVAVSAVGGDFGNADFANTNGTLVFTNGQKSGIIVVPIHDDYLPEETERFEVRLSKPSPGATLAEPSTIPILITDDDQSARTNSWLGVRAPDRTSSAQGRLRVEAVPQESGAQWRFPWELGWRPPGLATNLAAGSYDVEFRPVNGWEPQAQALQAAVLDNPNRTASITNHYFATGLKRQGSLTVILGPSDSEIATNGGWRLSQVGDISWLRSGTTLSNLAVGVHLIEFQPVKGWAIPQRRPVEVFEGSGSPIVTETYQPASASTPLADYPIPVKSFHEITEAASQDPQLPYSFCGQLQTDVGFGSGIAVRENVVLTAAHMVFNDRTLTWVAAMNWFFQKQEGEYEPRPARARGVHILAGYASARTNALIAGSRPGESIASSRLWDAAVLYFFEAASRNGYSGYLTSDSQQENEWLFSSNFKMLIGYPLDENAIANNGILPGKMHATAPRNYLFTKESSRVFLSSEFSSFAGNSGGPVCVKLDHQRDEPPRATYYPAGIYLGSVGSNSVVRSIDQDVVNLIHHALDSADVGKNHGQGGATGQGNSTAANVSYGYIRIVAQPSCITNDVKWWFDGDTILYPAHEPLQVFPYTWTIRFGGVPGYAAPGQQSVTVTAGHTNTIVVSYIPLNGASLQVNISPPEAIASGAQWFMEGETHPFASGDVLSTSPCEHLISFTPLSGFETPESVRVSLVFGRTNVVDYQYQSLPFLSLSWDQGLRLRGRVHLKYEIQVRPDLSTNSWWTNLWTGTLSNTSDLLLNALPTNQGNRFYRALLKP